MSITGTHTIFRYDGTDPIIVSSNTKAYFILWRDTLSESDRFNHQEASSRAYELTVRRLDCIARGMPDLHAEIEAKIWTVAFAIHNSNPEHSSQTQGKINPTWSDNPIGQCNCFEIARERLGNVVKPIVAEEEIWYQTRDE